MTQDKKNSGAEAPDQPPFLNNPPSWLMEQIIFDSITECHDNKDRRLAALCRQMAKQSPVEDLDYQDFSGNTALHYAVRKKLNKTVEALLELGVNPGTCNRQEFTPLHDAVHGNNPEAIKIFAHHGADLTKYTEEGMTPLKTAAHDGCVSSLRRLLENGANPDFPRRGSTALHFAALRGQHECVVILLDFHANIDRQNSIGETALHLSIGLPGTETLKELLARGAKTEVEDQYGITPLIRATQSTLPFPALEILVKHGADINYVSSTGLCALLSATARHQPHIQALQYLIAQKADVNIRGRKGQTALHVAVEHNNIPAASALLKAGADPEIKDDLGRTPMQYALEKKHYTSLVFLTSFLQEREKEQRQKERAQESRIQKKTAEKEAGHGL